MSNRSMILFVVMCAATLMCGKVPSAYADWRGPIVIPQQPQLQQPQLQQPLSISRDALKPTLQPLPSAPQVTTGNDRGNSGNDRGHDDIIGRQTKTEPHQGSESTTVTSPPPVSQPPVTEARSASDIHEKPALPRPEPSNPKTPWLLAAGVAVAAFLIGRRTRRVGPRKY